MVGIRWNFEKCKPTGVGYLISTNWCNCPMEKSSVPPRRANARLLESTGVSSSSPTQEPDDVDKGSHGCGDHKEACFRAEFSASYPRWPRECDIEQTSLRHAAAIARSDNEELAKIKSSMPADRPPERSCYANADADDEAKGENHPDIDCVFVRFHQMKAGKQRGGDQRCGPETG